MGILSLQLKNLACLGDQCWGSLKDTFKYLTAVTIGHVVRYKSYCPPKCLEGIRLRKAKTEG